MFEQGEDIEFYICVFLNCLYIIIYIKLFMYNIYIYTLHIYIYYRLFIKVYTQLVGARKPPSNPGNPGGGPVSVAWCASGAFAQRVDVKSATVRGCAPLAALAQMGMILNGIMDG